MQIEHISPADYQQYFKQLPRGFYNQSAEVYAMEQKTGQQVELLGLRDAAGTIVIAGKLRYWRSKKFFLRAELSFLPLPPAITPANFQTFLLALRNYMRPKRSVISLRLSPLLPKNYYQDLELIQPNLSAIPLLEALQAAGFQELKGDFFTDASLQPRYLYVKKIAKLSLEEIFSSLQYRVRNDMRKAERSGIKVRFLTAAELPLFQSMLTETVKRTAMPSQRATVPQAHLLQECPQTFHFALAYIDCPASLTQLAAEEEALQLALTATQTAVSKKAKAGQADLRDQLNSVQRRRAELSSAYAKYGSPLELAISQFCQSPSDLINLQSVCKDEFLPWSPVYAIHEFMLQHAHSQAISYYNFFAVEDPGQGDSTQGVLEFKRRFNGQLEEYVGTFEWRSYLGRCLEWLSEHLKCLKSLKRSYNAPS